MTDNKENVDENDKHHAGFIKAIGLRMCHYSKIATQADMKYWIRFSDLKKETIDKILVLIENDTQSRI